MSVTSTNLLNILSIQCTHAGTGGGAETPRPIRGRRAAAETRPPANERTAAAETYAEACWQSKCHEYAWRQHEYATDGWVWEGKNESL